MDPTWHTYAIVGVLVAVTVFAIIDTWDKS